MSSHRSMLWAMVKDKKKWNDWEPLTGYCQNECSRTLVMWYRMVWAIIIPILEQVEQEAYIMLNNNRQWCVTSQGSPPCSGPVTHTQTAGVQTEQAQQDHCLCLLFLPEGY